MEYLISILSGGVGGAFLIWILKEWISERLKQSIKHEYSEKLESYKTELNSKVESIKHENQVTQLRTSLFFDHQRDAFSSLITKIEKVNIQWTRDYEPPEGLQYSVPTLEYEEFKASFYKHQLFLDEECLMALGLVMESYNRAIVTIHYQNNSNLSRIIYLQPRIASIFRSKIGVHFDSQHIIEVAILSAIELVNDAGLSTISPSLKEIISTKNIKSDAEKVNIGLNNKEDLIDSLKSYEDYLSHNGSLLYGVQLNVKRTLKVLEERLS